MGERLSGRIAFYHYESRRARWWRELRAWARAIWHDGWGVVWFRPDRFSTLEVSLEHSDDGVNWEAIPIYVMEPLVFRPASEVVDVSRG